MGEFFFNGCIKIMFYGIVNVQLLVCLLGFLYCEKSIIFVWMVYKALKQVYGVCTLREGIYVTGGGCGN